MLPAKTLLNIFSCNLEKPKFSKCTPYLHKISSLIHLNVRVILLKRLFMPKDAKTLIFSKDVPHVSNVKYNMFWQDISCIF